MGLDMGLGDYDWGFGIGTEIEIGEWDWVLGIGDWRLGREIGIGD